MYMVLTYQFSLWKCVSAYYDVIYLCFNLLTLYIRIGCLVEIDKHVDEITQLCEENTQKCTLQVLRFVVVQNLHGI